MPPRGHRTHTPRALARAEGVAGMSTTGRLVPSAYSFRPFFLLAGLYAAVAVAGWRSFYQHGDCLDSLRRVPVAAGGTGTTRAVPTRRRRGRNNDPRCYDVRRARPYRPPAAGFADDHRSVLPGKPCRASARLRAHRSAYEPRRPGHDLRRPVAVDLRPLRRGLCVNHFATTCRRAMGLARDAGQVRIYYYGAGGVP